MIKSGIAEKLEYLDNSNGHTLKTIICETRKLMQIKNGLFV